MNGPTDKEIIKGCLGGDRALQEHFIRRFSRLVYSTIHRVVKAKGATLTDQDMEDLHNSAFVQLFDRGCRKLRRYQGRNGCSLASWVRMITVRMVLDHLRFDKDALAHRECLMPLDEILDLASASASPLMQLTAKEQVRLIEKGLRTLSAGDQLMIRLHCLEGQPLARVAAILKISAANVYSVKHRAVQRLAAAVQKQTTSKSHAIKSDPARQLK
ncbi:MAG: sigma-70 family RNA polymerase sigma factor [Desulfobacteraceae bacterium]|nr:MAG: sigma-70 family RNA polymerase sigma factor [Desulfobacteraceae bacterium]